MDERTDSITFTPNALTDAQRYGVACVVCGRGTEPMRPVGVVGGGQVFACSSHDERQDDDAEPCAPWCTGRHAVRYLVGDEPEGDDCHREVGRLGHADGYGSVVVSVANDYYGAPSIELTHITDTGREVEELLSLTLLDPSEVARLSELLACAAQMLTARKSPGR